MRISGKFEVEVRESGKAVLRRKIEQGSYLWRNYIKLKELVAFRWIRAFVRYV